MLLKQALLVAVLLLLVNPGTAGTTCSTSSTYCNTIGSPVPGYDDTSDCYKTGSVVGYNGLATNATSYGNIDTCAEQATCLDVLAYDSCIKSASSTWCKVCIQWPRPGSKCKKLTSDTISHVCAGENVSVCGYTKAYSIPSG